MKKMTRAYQEGRETGLEGPLTITPPYDQKLNPEPHMDWLDGYAEGYEAYITSCNYHISRDL